MHKLAVLFAAATCIISSTASLLRAHDGSRALGEGPPIEGTSVEDMSAGEIAGRICGSIALLALAALFSGLTLGLLSLDSTGLEIVREAGSEDDKRYAAIIYPLRKSGNLLLCTLVLGNMAVVSLNSVVMADLAGGLAGWAISTISVVIAGELIPQSVCARYPLYFGAKAVPLVRVIMLLLYPIAKPLALGLDWLLGEEAGTTYSKREFLKLVQIQARSDALHPTEAQVIEGAVTFRDKAARAAMTPVDRMVSVRASDVLDAALLERIFKAGYSRVPVWDAAGERIEGLLMAKDLILVTPEQRLPVIAVVTFFKRNAVLVVDEEDTLATVLKQMIGSRQHFAVVRTVDASGPGDPVYRVAGIITLEDIVEEILGSDIHDEYDAGRSVVASPRAVAVRDSELRGFLSSALRERATAHEAQQEAAAAAAVATAAVATAAAGPGHGALASGLRLSASEAAALAAHLYINCPPFKQASYSLPDVQQLVSRCPVVEMLAPASHGSGNSGGGEGRGEEAEAHNLFTRGRPADACYVILQGTVDVYAGADGIHTVLGPWQVLGERALSLEGHGHGHGHGHGGSGHGGGAHAGPDYVPDFTARPRAAVDLSSSGGDGIGNSVGAGTAAAASYPLLRCVRVPLVDFRAAAAACTAREAGAGAEQQAGSSGSYKATPVALSLGAEFAPSGHNHSHRGGGRGVLLQQDALREVSEGEDESAEAEAAAAAELAARARRNASLKPAFVADEASAAKLGHHGGSGSSSASTGSSSSGLPLVPRARDSSFAEPPVPVVPTHSKYVRL